MRNAPRRVIAILAAVATTLGLVPAAAFADPIIDHDPVQCIVAGSYPEFIANFSPSAEVASARLYFKASDTPDWYWVPFNSEAAGGWKAVLPKPSPSLRQIDYYLSVFDPQNRPSNGNQYHPVVDPHLLREPGTDGRAAGRPRRHRARRRPRPGGPAGHPERILLGGHRHYDSGGWNRGCYLDGSSVEYDRRSQRLLHQQCRRRCRLRGRGRRGNQHHRLGSGRRRTGGRCCLRGLRGRRMTKGQVGGRPPPIAPRKRRLWLATVQTPTTSLRSMWMGDWWRPLPRAVREGRRSAISRGSHTARLRCIDDGGSPPGSNICTWFVRLYLGVTFSDGTTYKSDEMELFQHVEDTIRVP